MINKLTTVECATTFFNLTPSSLNVNGLLLVYLEWPLAHIFVYCKQNEQQKMSLETLW